MLRAFRAESVQTATKAAPALTPPPGPHPQRAIISDLRPPWQRIVCLCAWKRGPGHEGRAGELAARVADQG